MELQVSIYFPGCIRHNFLVCSAGTFYFSFSDTSFLTSAMLFPVSCNSSVDFMSDTSASSCTFHYVHVTKPQRDLYWPSANSEYSDFVDPPQASLSIFSIPIM